MFDLLHRYTMFCKLSYNENYETGCILSFSQKKLVILIKSASRFKYIV